MQEELTESSSHSLPAARKKPLYQRAWFWLLVLCLAGAGYLIWQRQFGPAATAGKAGNKPPVMPTPVVVAPAKKADMNIYLTALGSVVPTNNVTVRSRVDGQLMAVHFREGQNVTKGSLLAVIDPRPFQVQLTQAEGQMARDREQLNNARLDLERYRTLWKQDSIPRQQLDTQEALVRQYEGAVKVDQGQIDNARLQLTYSRITAPISGRAGLRLVDAGNMVRSSDTNGLLTITQVQPINVVFPIPEDSLPQVLRRMKTGQMPVEAYDREMKQRLAAGELATVDNQIDPATGTIKLKATFTNKDSQLFPNQFVNVRLLLDVQKDATIVPSAAVQRSPQGALVYVLKPDQTVAMRPLKTGPSQGGETVVVEGLEVGEQVVVDGAERLRDGSKVTVKEPGQRGGRGQGGGPGQGREGEPKGSRGGQKQGP